MIYCGNCFLPSLGLRKDHLETFTPKPLELQQKCGHHSQESPSGVPSYWSNTKSLKWLLTMIHTQDDHSTVAPGVKTCKRAGANGRYARKSGITRMQHQAWSSAEDTQHACRRQCTGQKESQQEMPFYQPCLDFRQPFSSLGNLLSMAFKQLVETLLHLQPCGLQAFGKCVQWDLS